MLSSLQLDHDSSLSQVTMLDQIQESQNFQYYHFMAFDLCYLMWGHIIVTYGIEKRIYKRLPFRDTSSIDTSMQ